MGREVQSFSTTEDLKAEIHAAARREGVSQSEIINRALTQHFASKITRSSWDTDDVDSWYDEKKFYVSSQDKNGHSAYLRVWVPKNMAGQIGRVVNSGEIPEYRSAQDFYRDALLHRAHKVAQWIDNEELKAESGLHMMLSEEEKIRQMKQDVDVLIEQTKENFQTAWDRGDYDWLEQRIGERMEKVSSLPENLREDYVNLLEIFAGKLKEVRKGRVRHIQRGRPELANQ